MLELRARVDKVTIFALRHALIPCVRLKIKPIFPHQHMLFELTDV